MNGFNRFGQKIVKEPRTFTTEELSRSSCPTANGSDLAEWEMQKNKAMMQKLTPNERRTELDKIDAYCTGGGITLHDIEQAFHIVADAKELVRVVTALKAHWVFEGWPVVHEAYNPLESSVARMVRK